MFAVAAPRERLPYSLKLHPCRLVPSSNSVPSKLTRRRVKSSNFPTCMLRRWFLTLALLAACLGYARPTLADARTEFLMRMLQTSTQFRVRTQAALALGAQEPSPAVVSALAGALNDEHPAVRAASAAALERLKDPSALAALRRAQNDSDGTVRSAVRSAIASLESQGRAASATTPSSAPTRTPSGPATFYVGVGVPGSQVGLSVSTLRSLREHVIRQVTQLEGVRIAPENEDRRAAERVIAAGKLIGYFLDSSVTSIETRPDGSVRAQVSVVIGTYPGRDIRAMLSGAATVSGGGTGEAAKSQAVEAAFTGALRKLPQAMQAGLARAN